MKSLKLYLPALCLFVFLMSCGKAAQNEGKITFIVASDMGRSYPSEQQNIANIMGHMAEETGADFLLIVGDPIHDMGVSSIDDPEWELKIESIYINPSLDVPWYVISGNHEYRGSVQAVLDYSDVSERWNAPARYYSFEKEIPDSGVKCLFMMLDTPPLIDRYWSENGYDVEGQDMAAQLQWADSVLYHSDAKWKIVAGHHPVYADTDKKSVERDNMQERVGPILEKHGVDIYIAGHIHNFQHIRPESCNVNYIVNSSASKSRDVKPVDGTLFCNGDPGFTHFTVTNDNIIFSFVNHKEQVLHTYSVSQL